MDDMKNGQGVLSYPNGDRYEGDFKDDHMNGRGIFFKADGRNYTCVWINGKWNGSEDLMWPIGDRYGKNVKVEPLS